jgi:hypothetical protein
VDDPRHELPLPRRHRLKSAPGKSPNRLKAGWRSNQRMGERIG